MAIGDDRLAKLYLEVMSGLQVEVSAAKTWVSPHALEFAKRYFYRGVEVTPFPASSVCGHEGSVALLVAAMVGEGRKGLTPLSGIPGAVRTFKRTVGRVPKERVLRAVESFASRCLVASEFLSGRTSATETVVSVCGLDSSQTET